MALQKFGILRSFAKQRLEGRAAAFFETSLGLSSG